MPHCAISCKRGAVAGAVGGEAAADAGAQFLAVAGGDPASVVLRAEVVAARARRHPDFAGGKVPVDDDLRAIIETHFDDAAGLDVDVEVVGARFERGLDGRQLGVGQCGELLLIHGVIASRSVQRSRSKRHPLHAHYRGIRVLAAACRLRHQRSADPARADQPIRLREHAISLIRSGADGARIEGVLLDDIATRFGTPCYVYSRAALEAAFAGYMAALRSHGLADRALVCYAVKANGNLAILNLFARLGAGFDIVSVGELARVRAAGGDPAKVVFSGVGKRPDEMRAALEAGIHCFNVESARELEILSAVAGACGLRAPVSLRVNPDVDPKTHPYIATGLRSTKFGIAFTDALAVYRKAAALPHLDVVGIDCHIGSQLLDPAPAAEATQKLIDLVDRLAAEGIVLDHIDVGGGMGITYRDGEAAPPVGDYLSPMFDRLAGRRERIVLEPGRSLVGNAGVLLTHVMLLKHGVERNFAIVDAAMNDLTRPALYDAWHTIANYSGGGTAHREPRRYEIVGPVYESGDFLGHDRDLALAEGDLLAVHSAGAYAMSMASNYNTRPRGAEVMVDGDTAHLVRARERVEDLFAGETLLP